MSTEFNVDQFPDGRRFLRINSNNLDECLHHFKSGEFFGIAISRIHGYLLDNVDFLKQIPDVKGLYIQDMIHDMSGLGNLNGLKYLLINKINSRLDELDVNNLEELSITEWSDKHNYIERCKKLKSLYIYSYKTNACDLTKLPTIETLERLEIVKSPISSISGIEKFNALKNLTLRYMNKLENIVNITQLELLEKLEFDHCSKINNLDKIAQLTNITILGINQCGSLPSIGFIKKMGNLKRFAFVETNILDGDLSPCLELPKLEYVGFLDKRHYSHNCDSLNNLLKEKNNQQSK